MYLIFLFTFGKCNKDCRNLAPSWPNFNFKEGPTFHTFLQIFYKKFKILVLGYDLVLILYQFSRRLKKILPLYKESLFLYNKDSNKKIARILIIYQRWSHSDKTKTDVAFDLDIILTGSFFKKSHIFELSWVEKIKLYAFSEVQYYFN